jgi:hypothetical protein
MSSFRSTPTYLRAPASRPPLCVRTGRAAWRASDTTPNPLVSGVRTAARTWWCCRTKPGDAAHRPTRDYAGRMRFAIRVLVVLALPGLAFSWMLHLFNERSPECGFVWLQRAPVDPSAQCTPAPVEVAVIGFIAIVLACLVVSLLGRPRIEIQRDWSDLRGRAAGQRRSRRDVADREDPQRRRVRPARD